MVYQDQCETLPNLAFVIGRVAKPIACIIIDASKIPLKIENKLMLLPVGPLLETSFILLDVLTDE